MALRSRVEAAMFDLDAVVNDPNKYFWMNGIMQCSMINWSFELEVRDSQRTGLCVDQL